MEPGIVASPAKRILDGLRGGDTTAAREGAQAAFESTKQAAQKSWPHTAAWTTIALLLMKARPVELGVGVAAGAALNLVPQDKLPYQDKVTEYAGRFTKMFESDSTLLVLGEFALAVGLMNVIPQLKDLLPFGMARVFSVAVPLAAGLKMGDWFGKKANGQEAAPPADATFSSVRASSDGGSSRGAAVAPAAVAAASAAPLPPSSDGGDGGDGPYVEVDLRD